MHVLATLALMLGASWCAGINLYATVFALGALSRYTSFDLPQGLAVLESGWVLWPALGMYIVEFVADKVPAVDHAWDAVHTFLRIPAGAVLAAASLGQVPTEWQVLAALLGGGLAATSHTTKATTRAALHGTGMSLAAPFVSVGEDLMVVATAGLIATHPIVALFLVAAMMIGAYFILRTFWRLARAAIRGLSTVFGARPAASPS